MRILVGTLHTIEREYPRALSALAAQDHRDFEHFVISGLPNREAHDRLYRGFMDRAGEFDLFLKLDADMVLSRDTLLTGAADWFRQDPLLRNLCIGVHDFFTNRIVSGLHVFRSDVRWSPRPNHPFLDLEYFPRRERIVDWQHLAPAAYHCLNPSVLQSLHFGVHKGVKVVEAQKAGWPMMADAHTQYIEDTWRHFRRHNDRRLAIAVMGAERAIRGEFTAHHLNVGNPALETVALKLADMTLGDISARVRQIRRSNLAYLRWRSRLSALARYFRRQLRPPTRSRRNPTR